MEKLGRGEHKSTRAWNKWIQAKLVLIVLDTLENAYVNKESKTVTNLKEKSQWSWKPESYVEPNQFIICICHRLLGCIYKPYL